MNESMGFLSVLRHARRRHWWNSVKWALFTITGSVIAVMGGYVIATILAKDVAFADFFKNAEFALYSVAVIFATFHLVFKEGDLKTPLFDYSLLFIISLLCLVISLILFGAVAATRVGMTTGITAKENLDEHALMIISLIVFGITLTVCFFINLVDFVKSSTDAQVLEEEEEKKMKKIHEEFEAHGDDYE